MAEPAGGETPPAHRTRVRVYYEDTDAAGIVYYANYLRFLERARTEMLRDFGFNQIELMRDLGVAFAVLRCEIRYLKPARLDDHLDVESRITDIRGASLDFSQTIRRDDQELVRAVVTVTSLDYRNGRPTRVPAPIRQALSDLTAAPFAASPLAGEETR